LKNIFSLFVLSAGLLTAATAHASTMDLFSLTSGTDSYLFTLPASPTPTATNMACPDPNHGDFCLSSVSVSKNGVSSNNTVEFFTTSNYGGLELFKSNGHSFLNEYGSQLFTGSVTAPTFTLGTFSLSSDQETTDSLTISQVPSTSPVPEPSSIALLSTGLLAAAGTIRRRFNR
jgi:hypothetical protein